MDGKLVREAGFRFLAIPAGKWRRYFDLRNLLDIFITIAGFFSAFITIIMFWPDKVFIKGGYVGVPVGLAAWILRRPIIIHESDSVMGMANRILFHLAKQVFVSFPVDAYSPELKNKLIYTGVPINELFYSKETGDLSMELVEDKPLVLVIGGSQGARAINNIIKSILPQLLEKYQVVHLSGSLDYDSLKDLSKKMGDKNYHLVDSLPNTQMASLMKRATMIVSRAGATAISEIAAIEKPAILIPLKGSANDHQYYNVKYLVEKGAVLMVDQDKVNAEELLEAMQKIISSDLGKRLAFNIASFAKSDATQKITELLLTRENSLK